MDEKSPANKNCYLHLKAVIHVVMKFCLHTIHIYIYMHAVFSWIHRWFRTISLVISHNHSSNAPPLFPMRINCISFHFASHSIHLFCKMYVFGSEITDWCSGLIKNSMFQTRVTGQDFARRLNGYCATLNWLLGSLVVSVKAANGSINKVGKPCFDCS